MPHLSEYGYLHAAGNVLEYRYCADCKGNGPSIVLLHEGLGCCAMWKDFPQRLHASCGLAVFSYSRAGYGRSQGTKLPRPLSYMHDEAQQVLPELLAAAGLGQVVLAGHSDGASIAAIYAGGIKPNACRGLVLMAPHFFVEDISIESITKARGAFDDGSLRGGLEKYHGINTDAAFCGWNEAWLDPEFRSWDITGYLAGIDVPVLGLQGKNDEYGTMAQLNALESNCSASVEVQVLDDCGHAPHRDQPDMTIAAIAEFVAKF